MTLAEELLRDLQAGLGPEPHPVSEVRIGVFYTGVQLEGGTVGVAFTPRDLNDTVCCPKSAAAAPHAGHLAGQDAWELARYALSPQPLRRSVGVAVLNALAALAVERQGIPGGRLLAGVDALAAAGVRPDDRVAMVGGFVPFIKALKGQVADLAVIDKHPEALKPDERAFWHPPERATTVLAGADVVVMTGSTLVEGGLDQLLAACQQARRVVLAGPTASFWPPTLFRRGVHILGGVRVLDGPRLLQVVSEGGSGYFFEDYAEKVCVVREDA